MLCMGKTALTNKTQIPEMDFTATACPDYVSCKERN